MDHVFLYVGGNLNDLSVVTIFVLFGMCKLENFHNMVNSFDILFLMVDLLTIIHASEKLFNFTLSAITIFSTANSEVMTLPSTQILDTLVSKCCSIQLNSFLGMFL